MSLHRITTDKSSILVRKAGVSHDAFTAVNMKGAYERFTADEHVNVVYERKGETC